MTNGWTRERILTYLMLQLVETKNRTGRDEAPHEQRLQGVARGQQLERAVRLSGGTKGLSVRGRSLESARGAARPVSVQVAVDRV